MYVFQLFDYYGASGMCLLWFCLFECIALAWFYGADKFAGNIREMVGFSINPWFTFCWKYVSPVVTFGILSFSFITYKPIKYNNVYEYPWWGIAFGWFLALSSMIAIPVYMVYAFIVTPGKSFGEKWTLLTTSSPSEYVVSSRKANKKLGEEEASFPDIVMIPK